jgi:hypothetical protein
MPISLHECQGAQKQMRVFQVTPDGMASMFDAHNDKEAAEHAAFSLTDPGAAGFDLMLGDLAEAMDEGSIEIEFVPDFDFGPALKSPEEQLDQLGDIVENVSILAGMYAAMVAEARGHVDDEA